MPLGRVHDNAQGLIHNRTELNATSRRARLFFCLTAFMVLSRHKTASPLIQLYDLEAKKVKLMPS